MSFAGGSGEGVFSSLGKVFFFVGYRFFRIGGFVDIGWGWAGVWRRYFVSCGSCIRIVGGGIGDREYS